MTSSSSTPEPWPRCCPCPTTSAPDRPRGTERPIVADRVTDRATSADGARTGTRCSVRGRTNGRVRGRQSRQPPPSFRSPCSRRRRTLLNSDLHRCETPNVEERGLQDGDQLLADLTHIRDPGQQIPFLITFMRPGAPSLFSFCPRGSRPSRRHRSRPRPAPTRPSACLPTRGLASPDRPRKGRRLGRCWAAAQREFGPPLSSSDPTGGAVGRIRPGRRLF